GLTFDGRSMPTVALSGRSDPVILRGAYGSAVDGLIPSDAAGWKELRALLLSQVDVLKPLLARRPPDLHKMALTEKLALGGVALSFRRLGKEGMRDLLRMLLMNVDDVSAEYVENDGLRGLMAFDAVLGSHLGPRSPTSLIGLYYRLAGEVGGVSGG